MKKLIIGLLILGYVLLHNPTPLVADVLTPDEYINHIFGEDAKIAKAVILHESQGKLNSVNYNCIYDGKSTFCKKGDKHKAWSVDCGIGQINVRGQKCPDKLMTLDGNMEAIKRIYEDQGLNAWVSYKNGKYKKFL